MLQTVQGSLAIIPCLIVVCWMVNSLLFTPFCCLVSIASCTPYQHTTIEDGSSWLPPHTNDARLAPLIISFYPTTTKWNPNIHLQDKILISLVPYQFINEGSFGEIHEESRKWTFNPRNNLKKESSGCEVSEYLLYRRKSFPILHVSVVNTSIQVVKLV